ncbi:MAG: hypothetical protein WAO28_02465 [Candidatus Microsaccharimonas sp.]
MKHTFHPKHKIKNKGGIDTIALVVGILQPLSTIPQIYMVYSTHDASSVSLFMWASFNVASVVLLMYGLRHKLTPIIWAQTLWIIFQTPMMVSVFFFQ